MAADDLALPLRTLVVDDNRDGAETLARLVELQGNEVRIAYDGLSALEEARAFEPEVGLIDLQLPELDGFRVAKRLRELSNLHDMLLVAVTGFADRAHRALAQEAGFDKYLVKPFSLQQLIEILHLARATRAASSQRRAESQELRKKSEALREASAAVSSHARELKEISSDLVRRRRREELEYRLATVVWRPLLSVLASQPDCRGASSVSNCWCRACVERTILSVMSGEPVSDDLVSRLLVGLRPLVGADGGTS